MNLPVLSIPSQDLFKKPDLHPKQLGQWVDALPIGNISKATRQILKQLYALNRSYYPVEARMEMMDTLWPSARQLIETLRQSLKQAPTPLAGKHFGMFKALQQLREELAFGYKLVVSELAMWEKHESNNNWLQKALYRVCHHLVRQLVEAYAVYEPEPEGVWRELHQLYRYDTDIHSMSKDATQSRSVEFAYKRALLIALSEPYKLMQFEAEEVYLLARQWASACRICPLTQPLTPGQYVLDISLDHGPLFFNQKVEEPSLDGRIVDISDVKAQLELQIQQQLFPAATESGIERSSLTHRQKRDMLLRLANIWRDHATRQAHRHRIDTNIHITTGINACHYFISRKATFTPEMDALKLIISHEWAGKHDAKENTFMTAYRNALYEDRKHSHKPYTTISWLQRDISKAGTAMRCNNRALYDAKVGELVAYQAHKDHGHWQIGVIRWIKSHSRTCLDMGIMFLGSRAISIATQALSGIGVDTGYFRSLLIPQPYSKQSIRSLIVPVWLYDVNTVLSVNMNNRLFYVRLTQLVLSTRSLSQFKFEVLDQSSAGSVLN